MSRTLLRTMARLDTDAPDSILIERSRAGDPDAFARIVARHGPMVFAIARRTVGDGPDAEDVFQATFLVLFRRLKNLRDPDKLAAWLFGVAHRTACDLRRSRNRRANRLKSLTTAVADAPIPEVDLPGLVQTELAALPDHYRVPVALCDLDGRSRADAARLLNIPEGTLSSRLNTGRKRLAIRFQKLGYGNVLFAGPAPALCLPEFDPQASANPAVQHLVNGATQMLNWKIRWLSATVAGGILTLAAGTAMLAVAQAPPKSTTPATMRVPGSDKLIDDRLAAAPPVVVKTVPESGSENVDPDLKEIRATFSKKMIDKGWSFTTDERYGEDIPGEKPAYDKDGKTIVRAVKLKPNTTYAVWLNTEKFDNFKDTSDRPAVPYLWVFRTGPGKGK